MKATIIELHGIIPVKIHWGYKSCLSDLHRPKLKHGTLSQAAGWAFFLAGARSFSPVDESLLEGLDQSLQMLGHASRLHPGQDLMTNVQFLLEHRIFLRVRTQLLGIV